MFRYSSETSKHAPSPLVRIEIVAYGRREHNEACNRCDT